MNVHAYEGECDEDVQSAGTVVVIQGDDGQSSELTKDAMSEWSSGTWGWPIIGGTRWDAWSGRRLREWFS